MQEWERWFGCLSPLTTVGFTCVETDGERDRTEEGKFRIFAESSAMIDPKLQKGGRD